MNKPHSGSRGTQDLVGVAAVTEVAANHHSSGEGGTQCIGQSAVPGWGEKQERLQRGRAICIGSLKMSRSLSGEILGKIILGGMGWHSMGDRKGE